ncbi:MULTISPECIES: hypothetical protein [Vibrio]|uniref:hypothetical protein n=1 Tax=Vibrio TaxID=662 RepID=UPI0023A9E5A6|nr:MULTISPECIES: hypothetical protein [Vibrio]MDE5178104.1 hypothetical protein [Vibrio fluvialis]MDW1634566.1 hypothetical protein [Vibrio sp. Vb2907]MDW1705341.1 hypothetical protein [Vibrio sp. Vb2917]MDW1719913.1 hypothetical protein [Vibrio sp. Vb2979]
MEEYKKTCEDELDWASVNQLHEATLQISKSCFEFKKICVGLIGAALAVLVKITDNQLDHSYFSIPLLICFGFWIADFSAYYFQRKTRMAMNERLIAIAERNSISNYQHQRLTATWFGAAFNHSMTLYYALAFLGFIGWFAYLMDWLSN